MTDPRARGRAGCQVNSSQHSCDIVHCTCAHASTRLRLKSSPAAGARHERIDIEAAPAVEDLRMRGNQDGGGAVRPRPDPSRTPGRGGLGGACSGLAAPSLRHPHHRHRQLQLSQYQGYQPEEPPLLRHCARHQLEHQPVPADPRQAEGALLQPGNSGRARRGRKARRRRYRHDAGADRRRARDQDQGWPAGV